MSKSKGTKSDKRRKRRKLSKLLKSIQKIKLRIPVCKGGFAFKSKKDYNRKDNQKNVKEELNHWYDDIAIYLYGITGIYNRTHDLTSK